ncbi:uncharacterized protein N7500_003969 [Penicillium coprophilum]|uniref:uncharacterized protein n=1 Tax=Penicillium coprophilum TaxID=36646 RepID=UPI00238CDC64|nr:uncharacterized protein N7500_003969 [Penicillium coprophilum]KAJ5171186.1 hypothetical protein N7500_003969 [Penicillium coprophilum]
MSKRDAVCVDYPLRGASAWVNSIGRNYDNVVPKFSSSGQVCGFRCDLAGGVKLEMSIGHDTQYGFHVDAQKGNQYRRFYKQAIGQPQGVPAGGGNVAVTDWRTAMSDLNDHYMSGGQNYMVNRFISGTVISINS